MIFFVLAKKSMNFIFVHDSASEYLNFHNVRDSVIEFCEIIDFRDFGFE